MYSSAKYRVTLGLIAATLALPAVAQEDSGFIEEIVVVSTKRQATLQEIPVAVSVLQADDLQQSQVNDIKDLQFLVPSLRVTQLQSSGNTNFIIRGFGNGANNAGIEPSVGVFVDGVYRSRTAAALGDLPNLERVEVLRGPQSTLFGKNASAGVINVVTAKPSLDGASGSASLTVGEYSQVIAKGDLTGPLSENVGFSLAASYNQRDGYYDNLAGGPPLGEQNRYAVRGQLLFVPSDKLEIRLIADYDEFDEACCGVANLLNGPTGGLVQAIGGNLVPDAPFAYEGFYDFTPTNEFESSGFSAQIDYDIGDATTLTSITAFRSLSRFDNVDVDFTSAALLDDSAGNLTDTEIDTFTQELRLTGSSGAVDWMVGAYFFDEEVTQNTGIIYGPAFRPYAGLLTTALAGGIPGVDPSPLDGLEAALGIPAGTFFGAGQGNQERSGLDNQSFSIFAQADIAMGDRTTLTLGVNYTEDEKDTFVNATQTDVFSALDLVEIGFFQIFQALETADPGNPANGPTAAALSQINCSPTSPPPACNPLLGLQAAQFLPPFIGYPNAVESGSSSDDDTSYTVRLAYDLNDSVNVYGGVSTGFKASSWNLSRDSRPFASDIAALEAAGILTRNAAGALTPIVVPATRFALPEESTVYEIGLKARWDTVALNLALFDQEIENFQSNIFIGTGFQLLNAGKQSTTGAEIDIRWAPADSFDATIAATILDPNFDSFPVAACVGGNCDLTGTQPPGIHELSITAAGRYMFEVGNAQGFARVEFIHEDEVRVIENVPASVASREVNTLNASLGLSWENGFEAMLWGRNINNDEYLLSAFPSVAQAGSFSGYPNAPRTYGLTIRKYFD